MFSYNDNGRRHSMGKQLRPIGKDEFARMPWNLNLHPEKIKTNFHSKEKV